MGAFLTMARRWRNTEELSPSLENMVVLICLRLIHQDLPRLVKQKHFNELRTHTPTSIKPEISQALTSLLHELQSCENDKVLRSDIASYGSRHHGHQVPSPTHSSSYRHVKEVHQRKVCPLCKQASSPEYQHFLTSLIATASSWAGFVR